MLNTARVRDALRPCPVCTAEQAAVLHHQSFVLPEGHLLGDGYDVVSCTTCGFVYADTAAKQADYDRFYADLSGYESAVSSGGGLSSVERKRMEGTAAAIAAAVPDRSARIVDIGCAAGGLLRALRDCGFENLHGVDPSAACAAHVSNAGFPAVAGSLFALPEELGTFDAVLLTHVLEHVEDVKGALRNLSVLLAADGVLYLEVPDATRYADLIAAPFQDFNTEHINHFSGQSLDNACAAVGYQAVSTGAKLDESAPNIPYPVIYGFWRSGGAPRSPVPDFKLRDRIEEYIDRSRAVMDRYERRIRALLGRSPELFVWGTGQLTMKLLNETSLGQARIAAFIDGNPINHGRTLHGVQIVAPSSLETIDKPVLVASTIHFEAISRTIREKFGEAVEVVGLE